MYIAIYVGAILLFCAVILFVFWKKQKNEKARLANLKQAGEPAFAEKLHKQEIESKEVEQEVVAKKEDSGVMAELEEFSLDGEKAEKQEKKSFATVGRHSFDNLFNFENEEKEEDDSLSEEEIARYEKTLRDSLKFDMNEEMEKFNKHHSSFNEEFRPMPKRFGAKSAFEMEDDFDKMGGFGFDKFTPKPKTDIEQMINNLDPKLQEVIMSDVLAKKNYDE